MAIFKYKDRVITPGKGWSDDEGYKHPGNWNIWSNAEKTAKDITEITEDTPPDSRLYDWSGPDIDGKITSTAKDLAAVKTDLKKQVVLQQFSELYGSDWAIVRKVDKGTEVPSNIQTWRDAIRAKATEMENAIDNASDTDAVAALLMSFDGDAEANSMDKFREAAAKTLKIDITSKEEGDQEKITKEAESKREIEIKKYPFLSVWPELEE